MDEKEAMQRLQSMSPQDVMNELRKQGINSLDDLVSQTMKQAQGGDLEAISRTFIYRQFIYHEEG